MKKLILLLLLMPLMAFASSDNTSVWFAPMTKAEIAKEAINVSLSVIDYRQTVYIEHSGPRGFYEKNPMIGNDASDAKVRNYFILSDLLHYGVTKATPEKYRGWWQNSTLVWEAFIIGHNKYIGVKTKY